MSGSDVSGINLGFSYRLISNTADDANGDDQRSTQGSLRQFIKNANAIAGPQDSVFALSGSAPFSIGILGPLPSILDDDTTLDGTTQSGYTIAPVIELEGSGAGNVPGIVVEANRAVIRGLIIARFNDDGIHLASGGQARIESNWIGRNSVTGIGGGNGGSGIHVDTTGDVIGGIGVGNVISGNADEGIELRDASASEIYGNRIGTDPGGSADWGNGGDGIHIHNDDHKVGGILPGEGNVIAFNQGDGVVVHGGGSPARNSIRGNSIFENDSLGIELGANGVQKNDPGDGDSGQNDLFNFPVLETATLVAGNLTVTGWARPGTEIDLFVADLDPSNFGEGRIYLASRTEGTLQDLDGTTGSYGNPVNGLDQGSDTTNRFRFTFPVPFTVMPTVLLTATGTDGAGSTSEFSGVVTVTGGTDIDLSLQKTVDQTNPPVGSDVIFTLTLANASGFNDATGVEVTDLLPAGYRYVSDDSASSGTTYASGTGVWDVGSLTAGANVSLAITATVLGAGPYLNVAEVTAADQPDDDSTPGDGAGDDYDSVTISSIPRIDLAVAKVVDDSTPAVGSNVVFTVTVDNGFALGPAADELSSATGVELTDRLPTGYLYVADDSASSGTTYDPGSGVWNIGSLASGSSIALEITARVLDTGSYTNDAEITAADPTDRDSIPGDGSGDDFATVTPVPVETIDLSLTKSVDDTTPPVGSNVTFTVTLSNASGRSEATGVEVADLLPSGYAYVADDSASTGTTYNPVSGIWDVGTISSGADVVLNVDATVLGSGAYQNRAEVTAADQQDADSTPGDGSGDDYDAVTPVPQAAIDLSLGKVVDDGTPAVGSNVVFTVTLANAAGLSDATGVEVTDLLPSGYTYVSDDSASSGTTYNPLSGVWDVGSLTAGSSVALAITATVRPSGIYDNVAEVTAADQADVDSTPGDGGGDDRANASTTPQATIDLSVTKIIDDPTPPVGSVVTFTVTLTNDAGLSDASGVQVTDLLASGYSYVSDDSASSGTSYNPVSGLWDVGNLASGANVALALRATVLGSGVYANVAEVTTAAQTDRDSVPGDGSGDDFAEQLPVPIPTPTVDLELNKSVDDASPLVGATVEFTLSLTNRAGFSDATGVQVRDLLPSGYVYLADDSGSSGTSYTPPSGLWDVGAVAAGATVELKIQATVLGAGLYQNDAEVIAADQPDVDSTPNDGAGDDHDSATAAPNAVIDLSVTKTVDQPTPSVADNVVFSITATNAGGFSDATGVQIRDLLPSGFVYVSDDSASSGTTYSPGSGLWDVGSLTAGSSETLQVTATVLGSGAYGNEAECVAADQPDFDSTPGDGSGDDHDSASVTPTAAIDLSLTKVVSNGSPMVGDDVVFTVTVSNAAGLSDATGVQVADLLPSGYSYVADDSGSSGTTYAVGSGLWSVGALAAGASESLNLTATVLGTGAYQNVAEVSAAGEPDVDSTPADGSGDDYATVTPTPVPAVDLSLSKSVDNPTPTVGSNVTFTIQVANAAGLSDGTNVQVRDLLPSGFSYVSDDAASTGTSYAPLSGLWSVGTLAAGSTVDLEITATVLGSGVYLNAAEVTAATETDRDSLPGDGTGDDHATATAAPGAAIDLSLSKTVDDGTPNVGDDVVFTIDLANAAGLSDASGVLVTDLLPTGYSYVSDDSASTGSTYTPGTGIWNVGIVAAGATRSLEITATVLGAGNYLNTAEVSAADQPDLDSTPGDGAGDDFDTVSPAPVPIPTVDLSLAKSVSQASPAVGTNVIFTVDLSNAAGFSDATGVRVTDLLPSGYVYVADDSASSGTTYSPATGVWDVGALAAGSSRSLNLTATVLATGSYLNVAEVTAADQPDTDSTPADGLGDDHASIGTTPGLAVDLSIAISVDDATPLVGNDVVFTIDLSNAVGVSDATGVQVLDLLPSGYAYVSDDSASSGTNYASGAGVWDVGAVAAGATIRLNLTATVLATGSYLNTAEVVALDQVDLDSIPADGAGDDFDSVSTTPGAVADLSLTLDASPDEPAVGNPVVFTLDVENNGPTDAAGVSVLCDLPSGYSLVAHDGGTAFDPSTGVWTPGVLPLFGTATLSVTASVNATGSYMATAEIMSSSAFDPDSTPGNADPLEDDWAEATTTPVVVDVPLVLTKSVHRDEVEIGDALLYTISIRNTETDDVDQVRIEDTPGLGFRYQEGSARLDGVPIADPVSGRPLVFDIGTVPGLVDGNANGIADPGEPGYRTLSYQLVVGSGMLPGRHENRAVARNACVSCEISNPTSVSVSVRLDPAFDLSPIVGKVFRDDNENGRQDEGEPGVAEAMVALDDGTYALTDLHGRYHLPSVKSGQRMLKLNRHSLPPGAEIPEARRVLWVTPGLMAQADFAVTFKVEDESIGRAERTGIEVVRQDGVLPVPIAGNAETLSVLVAGKLVEFRSSAVEFGVEELNPVVRIGPAGLEQPLLFRLSADLPDEIEEWRLFLEDGAGEEVHYATGSGAPPPSVSWDGRDAAGSVVLRGGVYAYGLEIRWRDGAGSRTPLHLLGVDRGEVISMRLTGEAFETGSAILSGKARTALAEAAKTLRRYPDERVFVEGHTDSVGADEANLALSRSRAEAARAYLTGAERLAGSRFVLKAFGESRPIAPNDFEEGRALNRRVEIKGELEYVDRAALTEARRTQARVVVDGVELPLGRFGEFHDDVDPGPDQSLAIAVSDSHGRAARETVRLPLLSIEGPEARLVVPRGGAAGGCRDVGTAVSCTVLGRAEPGHTVERGGRPVDVDAEGRFAFEMELAPGRTDTDLLVRDPRGFQGFTRLTLHSSDRDESGNRIVLVEGIPHLTVALPASGTELSSQTLPVRGSTDPGNRVEINGAPVDVSEDGSFSAVVELTAGTSTLVVRAIDSEGRAGTIERVLEAPRTQLFLLAFAEGKLGQIDADGAIESTGLDEDGDLYTEGRVAFYLKGRIKGKYLITSAVDTDRGRAEYLFRDVAVDQNDYLLRNLDPDKEYAVYGDGSTVVFDAQTQGNFYLALDGEEIDVLIGNHEVALDDGAELATYRRTQYGARFDYVSSSGTEDGVADTEVVLFGSEVERAHVQDELRATGASLYYLSHRDVVEGSEQVVRIVRDKLTGVVLSRETQQQNVDYTIKYEEGRLIFHRPLSSTVRGGTLVDPEVLGGHPVFVIVDYDTELSGFEETAYGGRIRQRVGERIVVGGTYVRDEADGAEYELSGVDAEVRLPGARLIAEVADSTGFSGRSFVSEDGGLSFTQRASVATREGTAHKLAAELDVGHWFGRPEHYRAGLYFKELEPGFSSSGNGAEEGTEKAGAHLSLKLTEHDTLRIKSDTETRTGTLASGDLKELETRSAQWEHRRSRWGVAAEYYDSERRDTLGASLDDNTLAATRAWWKPGVKWDTRLDHQQTIDGVDNDRTTAAVSYRAASWLALEVEGSSGSRGDSGRAGAIVTHKGGEIYLTREDSENVVGQRAAIGPGSRVFSEYRWENDGPDQRAISLLGIQRQWEPGDGWKLTLSGESAGVDGATEETRRTAINAGVAYRGSGRWSGFLRQALRNDDGSTDRRQWVGIGQFDLSLSPDWTARARYRYSTTDDRDAGATEASFSERVFSLAYRPVAHNRFNSLLRYSSLSDRRPLLLADGGKRLWEVMSLDTSFRLIERVEWQTKTAFRNKREWFADLGRHESKGHLLIQRFNVDVYRPVGIGVEYRLLGDTSLDDSKQGWLMESSWQLHRHFRIGAGYNFTDFTDDTYSANDYSARGWFLRVQGVY